LFGIRNRNHFVGAKGLTVVYKEGLQKAGPFVTVLPQVRCEGPAPDFADHDLPGIF
jgi:hypothetical protein